MVKIKKVILKNYCGYLDTTFDFTHADGSVKNLAMFYGFNGCGKSTLLDAVELLSCAQIYENKKTDLLFRKITHHADYDPDLENFKAEYKKAKEEGRIMSAPSGNMVWAEQPPMEIEGIFDTDLGEKRVVIETNGVVLNELPKVNNTSFIGHCNYIDADNMMNMSKFQLPEGKEHTFMELAKATYDFDCELLKPIYDSGVLFYTDFTIKKDGIKIHFKRMSDGEKKIATLFRGLCDPDYANIDIILIDNFELHSYFLRHRPMLDKVRELFPDKQFIMTTHSPLLVGCLPIGLKPYVGEEYLYDVVKIKQEQSLKDVTYAKQI